MRAGGNRHTSGHAFVDFDPRLENVLTAEIVVVFTANWCGIDLLAIDGDHELMRLLVAFNTDITFSDRSKQAARQDVLGVRWEIVMDEHATARTERQSRHVLILGYFETDRERRRSRLDLRISHGKIADVERRSKISFEQQRGCFQRRCDVVESEVSTVAWQHVGHINFNTQQVADRVRVLCAI